MPKQKIKRLHFSFFNLFYPLAVSIYSFGAKKNVFCILNATAPFFGAFMRGRNPPVIPGGKRKSGATIKTVS